MKTLSIRQMRNSLGDLESLVCESGEIVITRYGKSVARVLPIKGSKPKPNHAALRNKMSRLDMPSEVLLTAERDER